MLMIIKLILTLQGKLLQLRLPDEVLPATSKAQRSLATGHLQLMVSKVTSRQAGHAAPAVRSDSAEPAPAGGPMCIANLDHQADDDSCLPDL